MVEKRKSPRRHTLRLVSYARITGGRQIDQMGLGNTLDLSEGGLRMAIAQPLAEGDRVDVELALDDALIHARAKVVHVEEVTQYLVGLEFEGALSEDDLAELRHHLPQRKPAAKRSAKATKTPAKRVPAKERGR